MAPIIPDQPLPRRSASGMATRAVNAAAGVLHASMMRGRQIPTSLAIDLDAACLLNSPETAAELQQLRNRIAEAVATVARQAQKITGLERIANAEREHVAELEAEAAGQRRAGYQVAINVMRQEKLPMSVELLEAQLELEVLDYPKPHERPAGAYPPALLWAQKLDADDLEGFLADVVDAASGTDDLATLAEVESAIARWRAIGEAQHAHNTAPGPDAPEADEAPTGQATALLAGQREQAEADGITCRIAPTQALQLEDPHDSPLHHDYRVSRDLPEVAK